MPLEWPGLRFSFVPSLARGTTLHQIVYQFKGDDPIRIEQIAEEAM